MKLTDNAGSGWLLKAVAFGIVTVAIFWIISLLLGGMIGSARVVGESVNCQSNVMNLARGLAIYAEDNEGYLPQNARWMDHVAAYVDREGRLHCPTVSKPSDPKYGYAMSTAAGGIARNDDTKGIVLTFDSTDTHRNAAGTETLEPKPGRHRGRLQKGTPYRSGNVVGLVGGAVKFVPDSKRPIN